MDASSPGTDPREAVQGPAPGQTGRTQQAFSQGDLHFSPSPTATLLGHLG